MTLLDSAFAVGLCLIVAVVILDVIANSAKLRAELLDIATGQRRKAPSTSAAIQATADVHTISEAVWRFQCASGHVWWEPYAQAGTTDVYKSCVVRGCTKHMVTCEIVTITYGVKR